MPSAIGVIVEDLHSDLSNRANFRQAVGRRVGGCPRATLDVV